MKKRVLFLFIYFILFMGYGVMNVKADIDVELSIGLDDDISAPLEGTEENPVIPIHGGITKKIYLALNDIESYENIKSIQFTLDNSTGISASNFVSSSNSDFEVQKDGNKITLNVLNRNRELDWSYDNILEYNISVPSNPSKQTLKVGISNIKINYINGTSSSISNKAGYVFVVNNNLNKECDVTYEISDNTSKKVISDEVFPIFETKSDKISLKLLNSSPNSTVRISKKVGDEDEGIPFNETVNYNLNYGEGAIIIMCQSEFAKYLEQIPSFQYFDSSFDYEEFFEASGGDLVSLINVIRIDTRSAVNTLNSLKVVDYEIKFNKMVKFYNVTVPNDVTSVKIESTLTDSKSKYEKNFCNRTVDNLKVGNNSILVKVISEQGKTNTYTINVTREKNNDGTLKELIINEKSIKLKEDTFKYDFTVLNDVTKVDVKAAPNAKTSKVEIKNLDKLEIGQNVIEIIVTAEDNSKQIYNVLVEREKEISNNAYLSDLQVENYNLDFDRNIFNYDLEIKDEKELKINSVLDNSKAKLLVTGNRDLKNGSVIKLKITAEDGVTTKEYQINIIKKAKISLPLIGGVIGGIVLVTFASISISKNKKKKSNFSNE